MSNPDDNLPAVADYSSLLHFDWRNHWLTPVEYAAQQRRPVSTVHHWCQNGTLDAFHIPHIRDRRGRWWIKNVR